MRQQMHEWCEREQYRAEASSELRQEFRVASSEEIPDWGTTRMVNGRKYLVSEVLARKAIVGGGFDVVVTEVPLEDDDSCEM
jgi:hypothetical protein